MRPCMAVAVSVAPQWIRPTGWRIAEP
jgi:hypothetical protein